MVKVDKDSNVPKSQVRYVTETSLKLLKENPYDEEKASRSNMLEQ